MTAHHPLFAPSGLDFEVFLGPNKGSLILISGGIIPAASTAGRLLQLVQALLRKGTFGGIEVGHAASELRSDGWLEKFSPVATKYSGTSPGFPACAHRVTSPKVFLGTIIYWGDPAQHSTNHRMSPLMSP